MNYRTIKWQVIALLLFVSVTACTKIDVTKLGGDLIPDVDNINTFEMFLPVVANNYIVEDSTRLQSSDAHPIGAISNDPMFGSSKATLFFELKPSYYKFQFADKDNIAETSKSGFDSAVLILNYTGYYGDSSAPVTFKLYEVDKQMQSDPDTTLRPNYDLTPNLAPNLSKFWGQKTMAATQFKDSIPIKRHDSVYSVVTNQLRIPLDQAKAKALFYQDTLGAFESDEKFKNYLPGFALTTDANPQTLFYFTLSTSKIEFYYRANPLATVQDTTSASFGFTGLCAHAVKFEHNRSGAEINNWLAPNLTDGTDQIYVQTTPGTAASIHIKGLDTLTNKVIHRAELRVTQLGVPTGLQAQLTPPTALYLDVKDTIKNVYKGIPYDLSPFVFYYCYPQGGIQFPYFGGLSAREMVSGTELAVYRFNISRFVQGIISRGEFPYDLRLSAPFYNYYDNCANGSLTHPQSVFPFTFIDAQSNTVQLNQVGQGRVRVAGGGPNVDSNLRMQLRIIYSKL